MRLWLFFFAVSMFGQVTTSSISGHVLDPSSSPMAKVEITISQPNRGAIRKTFTTDEGFYEFTGLAPASYTISANTVNFCPASAEVSLAVNTQMRTDFHMVVHAADVAMNVTGVVHLIPSDSSELGIVFDQSRIQDLPLNRRDFLQLALLAPGVTPAVQNSELSQRGGFAMHASGGREEFNSYLIDGVDNNDHYENSFALQPPVDSIQEFKIATSAYSAEYGRNAGGQVNLITRGGGNTFHGSLYEYLRNQELDARNFFDAGSPQKLIRNQFGVTAGGRVVKDRTFFFANFDG